MARYNNQPPKPPVVTNTNPVWILMTGERYARVFTSQRAVNNAVKEGALQIQQYEVGELNVDHANRRWHGYELIEWM